MSQPPCPAPIVHEGNLASPVILSLPHSGRDIDETMASRAAGGRDALLALSDPHVDAIAQPFIEAGHAAVVAMTPRAVIDPNRRLDELDPMICDCPPPPPGSKAASGIGLVPSRGRGRRPLWKVRPGLAEVERRIEQAWRPYHHALAYLVERTKTAHGFAVLLDCHSMPPPRRGLPRIVLGDRHGTSADPALVDAATRAIAGLGEECALNHPYAGGAITAMYGRPDEGVHALQFEIDRAFYLDPLLKAPGPGLARAQLLLGALIDALGALPLREAAE